MPKIKQTLKHTLTTEEACCLTPWEYEATSENIIQFGKDDKDNYCNMYFKKQTEIFYADLKSLLQQTNIENIEYDDDKQNIKIFDFEFNVKCFGSGIMYNDSAKKIVYKPNFQGVGSFNGQYDGYCYIIYPYIILPRQKITQDQVYYQFKSQYNIEYQKVNSTFMNFRQPLNYGQFSCSIPQTDMLSTVYQNSMCKASRETMLPEELEYTIELYYNTNYIICEFAGNKVINVQQENYKYPLFTFLNGKCISKELNMLVMSSYFGVRDLGYLYHSYPMYNYIKYCFPKLNDDKKQYYNYYGYKLENNGYIAWEREKEEYSYNKNIYNIFDLKRLPDDEIIKILSTDNSINNDVVLHKLTGLGGYVEFDNVYDVSRDYNTFVPASTLKTLIANRQFSTGFTYKINGEDYYCPGYKGFGITENGYKFLFKL